MCPKVAEKFAGDKRNEKPGFFKMPGFCQPPFSLIFALCVNAGVPLSG
jgi:hypothetical protein